MDQELLELEMLTSDEIISESNIKIEKYDRAVKRNTRIILILGVLTLASTVAGGVYAKIEDGEWYFILLFAFLGGLAGFVAGGIILLIAKPFLYIGRKKLLNMLPEVEEQGVVILEAKCGLLHYYINNAPADNPWKRADRPKKLPSASQIFDDWVDTQNSILDYTCSIRRIELIGHKYAEWAWILNALAIAILCTAFIIAIHLFVGVLIVMLAGLAIYFGMLDGINDTSRPYKDDGDSGDGTEIFSAIFRFIAGPMNEKSSEISQELDYQRSMLDTCKTRSNEQLKLLVEYYFPHMDKKLIRILEYQELRK